MCNRPGLPIYFASVLIVSLFLSNLTGCSKQGQAVINDLFVKGISSCQEGDFEKAIIYQKSAIQELKKILPANKFEEIVREKDLKEYLNQLKNYQNNEPWRVR